METRLNELKEWLLACNYPLKLINKQFHNAKLQGPAPQPKPTTAVLPYVTTHFSNLDSQRIVQLCNNRLSTSTNSRIQEVFGDSKTVLALKQPPNLLRHLTKAKFQSIPKTPVNQNGLFKCDNVRCKLCRLYIQECSSLITANGIEWFIKGHITCNSVKVIYYLECVSCNGGTTYTGKTNIIRKRMSNHITCCFSGNTSDIFDVYKCRKEKNINSEPYFRIYVFMQLPSEHLLLTYESYLHKLKFDTMN